MFVVFDLDGTLADCSHRMHHIAKWQPLEVHVDGSIVGGDTGPSPDWDAFYRACVDDKPMHATINTLIAFRAAGARVEIWTGRSDLVRAETERWLLRHGVGAALMIMRAHGDHQPDVQLKRSWLHACYQRPDLVLEDRARVVAMFREEGIPCFQVAEGAF